jgi:gamma-glutamylputrescine oxidase
MGLPLILLPHLEVQSARNQVLVLKTDVPLKIKGCFHFHKGYVYFRNVGEHLLIGGGRHLDITSENTLEWDFNPTITNYLIAFAERHLLQNIPYRITDHWTGILGLGPEKKPIIEMISPSVAVAVRMGGMGVAIGNSGWTRSGRAHSVEKINPDVFLMPIILVDIHQSNPAWHAHR